MLFLHCVQLDKCRVKFVTVKLNDSIAKYRLIQLTLFVFSKIIYIKIYFVRHKPVNLSLIQLIFQMLVKNDYQKGF